jgi:D-serine dehydratase
MPVPVDREFEVDPGAGGGEGGVDLQFKEAHAAKLNVFFAEVNVEPESLYKYCSVTKLNYFRSFDSAR